MSLWDELLPKLTKISADVAKNLQRELDASLAVLDKFEKDLLSGRLCVIQPSDTAQLRSILEDDDESKGTPISDGSPTRRGSAGSGGSALGSKKRSKEDMGGNNTPEQDKRLKRNASVRAQGIISKQVNMSLGSKLRRPLEEEAATGGAEAVEAAGAARGALRGLDDDKENRADNQPALVLVKQEKISLPAATVEMVKTEAEVPVAPVKLESDKEMMPPPAPMPTSRSRKAKEKKKKDVTSEPESESAAAEERVRRSTRRKPAESAPPPPPASERHTRASSRLTQAPSEEDMPPAPPPEPRPKRTRARKQQPPDSASESDAEKPQEMSAEASVKPRPKRTRRGRKLSSRVGEAAAATATEGAVPAPVSSATRVSSEPSSHTRGSSVVEVMASQEKPISLEETQLVSRASAAASPAFAAAPPVPAALLSNLNETVVLEAAGGGERDSDHATVVLGRAPAMDETVIINKGASAVDCDQLTEDSLLTEDGSEEIEDTPPRSMIPVKQATSAVKERVQQFEELASGARLTRTKTRALAKQSADSEQMTPPDSAANKPTLSAATLAKLNSMPSGYRHNQISLSASKPRSNIVASVKSFLPSSTSKVTGATAAAVAVAATVAAADELRAKEHARRKKEALLEAKREEGRRRREQKMAAAAAMREELARERAAQLEATARGRQEKQAHADLGKLEKLREVEKKRAAMERKAAETEARRRAEEAARQARLEEEQRRAEAARRKQQEEAERIKKEELRVEREMQQARQIYFEKERERERQKLLLQKQRMDTDRMHTPMKAGAAGVPAGMTPCKPMAPVHMADGFQNLNSDTDEEDSKRKQPVPDWSRSKVRWERLGVQEQVSSLHVDKLFSVQKHTPDLRELFPAIDRRMLKRTSSAVWRTPPRLPQLPE